MVSDKNTQRNILIIIFLCSIHEGITAEGASSCYISRVLVLGHKLILGKPSNCFQVGKVVSPTTPTFMYLLKILTTRFTIFMINICIYNHPFKIFVDKKHEGVGDLICGNVRETS
jgi:hypothetical protein